MPARPAEGLHFTRRSEKQRKDGRREGGVRVRRGGGGAGAGADARFLAEGVARKSGCSAQHSYLALWVALGSPLRAQPPASLNRWKMLSLHSDEGAAAAEGEAGDGLLLPSDSSAVTLFADDAAPAAEAEKPNAAAEAPPPPPPLVRLRGGTVREEPVVALDLAKKAKVKDAPTPANTYAAKKTVAQGMMDIALITSNANQLRYLFEFASESSFYHLNVALISVSLMLQIAVGVTLIFKGRADLSGERKMEHANRLNNYVVGGVFLVTIINVFLAAFSVSNTKAPGGQTPQP
ncbi:hypothetical protein R5R35_013097 [Gryllus longicercus]|uniref:Ninjurin-1 n=1 Tax=Gryllus longicercus TaxID=2509291 RepID=A0AAN9VG21_9ORTH